MTIATVLGLLLPAVAAYANDAPRACSIRAEVLEVSPGWSCASLNEQLRAFERRVCISLLRAQRPHFTYRVSAEGNWSEDSAVPPEVRAAAWQRWSSPVVVGLNLRPSPTLPAETSMSGPLQPGDVAVHESSGESEVDLGVLSSVVSSGGRNVCEECPRNYWKLRVTFGPPAIPVERHPAMLRGFLNAPDPWARLMAAASLLALGHDQQQATTVLEHLRSSRDERISWAAASALRNPESYK